MRLIDADDFAVRLKEQHDYLMQDPEVSKAMKWREAVVYDRTLTVLNEMQTVDAIEVVRCKDCIHDNMTTCPLCWIENHTMEFINHNAEDFCSYGERRSE